MLKRERSERFYFLVIIIINANALPLYKVWPQYKSVTEHNITKKTKINCQVIHHFQMSVKFSRNL